MNSEDNGSPSYEVLITPEAHMEMTEAYNWYQRRKRGFGGDFLRALNDRLAAIEREPNSYPVVLTHKSREIHRALLKRFPYGIIYFIKDRTVIVIACFHASRDPKQWQRRTEEIDS